MALKMKYQVETDKRLEVMVKDDSGENDIEKICTGINSAIKVSAEKIIGKMGQVKRKLWITGEILQRMDEKMIRVRWED